MENLNEKQQIEEMAKVIKSSLDGLGCGNFNFTGEEISTMFAKALYNAGYRKQSEVVKAIADFMYDGEIEGLAIFMGGVFLTKNEFIDKFAGAKMKGGE